MQFIQKRYTSILTETIWSLRQMNTTAQFVNSKNQILKYNRARSTDPEFLCCHTPPRTWYFQFQKCAERNESCHRLCWIQPTNCLVYFNLAIIFSIYFFPIPNARWICRFEGNERVEECVEISICLDFFNFFTSQFNLMDCCISAFALAPLRPLRKRLFECSRSR